MIKSKLNLGFSIIVLLMPFLVVSQGNDLLVSNSDELNTAIRTAKPNDHIILRNGVWKDVAIKFNSKTQGDHPITLRSEKPGEVILSGSSSILVSEPNLIVDGILFENGSLLNGSVITLRSDNCIIRNIAIVDYNPLHYAVDYSWVKFKGSNNIVENCLFEGKNNDAPVVVNSEDNARSNVIKKCHFKDIPLLRNNNGREIIKVVGYGHSDQDGDDGAFCIIENNLFDHADGEGTEIISIKSNHNTIRNNTVIACSGGLVNRRGSKNLFENNVIIGEGKTRSLGIRVANKNNTVSNNYISNVALSGIVLMTGEYTDSVLTKDYDSTKRMKSGRMVREPRYGAVKHCTFSNNTIVSAGVYGFDIGFSYKKRWSEDQIVLLPEENRIINNLIINSGSDGINVVKQDTSYPLDQFKFKSNFIEGNLILKDRGVVINELGFLNHNKEYLGVGVDHSKLHILQARDVGPNWMSRNYDNK